VRLRARIHDPKDVIAGLLFVAIGLATIVGASDYPLGAIRNIGPGYFPILLGVCLALLGAAVAYQGIGRDEAAAAGAVHESDEGLGLRPLIMITLAVVAFGFLVRPLGLAAATVALVVISSLAGRDFSAVRVAVLSVALVTLSWLIFIKLLGLSMTLWPR